MEGLLSNNTTIETKKWFKAAKVEDIPENGGAAIKYKDQQIAIFNFKYKGQWYACQNLCPHRFEMILSRGIIGDLKGVPKVACPFHKKTFSLESGECLSGDNYQIETYPVKIEEGYVYLRVNK